MRLKRGRRHRSCRRSRSAWTRRRGAPAARAWSRACSSRRVLRELSKVRGFHRFDELPIPFRAVATDLVTGKAVVLAQGELASAMRASMSVPGAIAPARLDGQSAGRRRPHQQPAGRRGAVDGRRHRDRRQPRHAAAKADQLNSVLGVTGQMVNILTEQNVQASLASLKPNDVLVLPQLDDFSAADFDHLPRHGPDRRSGGARGRRPAGALSVSRPELRRRGEAPRLAGQADASRRSTRSASEPTTSTRTRGRGRCNKPGSPSTRQSSTATCAASTARATSSTSATSILEEPGQAHPLDRRGREVLGSQLPAPRPRPLDRLPGRRLLQAAGELPHDMAELARRRVAQRPAGGTTNRVSTEFYQPLEPSQTCSSRRGRGVRRSLDVFPGTQRVATLRHQDGLGRPRALGAQFTGTARCGSASRALRMRATLDTGPLVLARRRRASPIHGIVLQASSTSSTTSTSRAAASRNFEVLGARPAPARPGFGRAMRTAPCTSFGDHTFNFGFTAGGRLGADPCRLPCLPVGRAAAANRAIPRRAARRRHRFARIVYYKRLLDGACWTASTAAHRSRSAAWASRSSPATTPAPWSGALLLGVDTPLGPLYLGYGRTTRNRQLLPDSRTPLRRCSRRNAARVSSPNSRVPTCTRRRPSRTFPSPAAVMPALVGSARRPPPPVPSSSSVVRHRRRRHP